ncbi:helix-turn-helix transcriptional regulator [Marinobacter alexandrii]|uniref:helix-turn-helix transcriptional regulator n=1 Tax=Marinobacter alexandrii TaxID=2570351 RepID=UPI00329A36A4
MKISKFSAVHPVWFGLHRLGFDADKVFSRHFPDDDSDKTFIPSRAIYDMMESCAREAENQHFGSHLADAMESEIELYYGLAAYRNAALIEKLVGMQIAEKKMSGANAIEIHTECEKAHIFIIRSSQPQETTQTDAWCVTTLCRVIQSHLGKSWNGGEVAISISDRNVVPAEVIPQSTVRIWEPGGFKLTFPVEWLLHKTGDLSIIGDETDNALPINFVNQVKAVLRPAVANRMLTLDMAAQYCGLTSREFQTKLADNGATFSQIAIALRQEYAEKSLIEGIKSVSAISDSLGYSDVSAFNRAFKQWTGLSPGKFRQQSAS